MAIEISADDPQGLLDSIYEQIDDGSIETWAYDDAKDFFHDTADGQWTGQAWLRPSVSDGTLLLNIIPPTSGLSMEAYAVYHGRFIEMVLAHFDTSFSRAFASARPAEGDDV